MTCLDARCVLFSHRGARHHCAGKGKDIVAAATTTHEQTYTPQNILVTGGAGFVGSDVCFAARPTIPSTQKLNALQGH